MAYSTNPNLPKARANAMRLLMQDELPLLVVARMCGVHRTTIWRWKQKWLAQNPFVQLKNYNRPSRELGKTRLASCTWNIATQKSTPKTYPNAIPEEIVARILAVRDHLKRCAEVVWWHLTKVEKLSVSLSSVRRILRRHHYFDGARKPRLKPDNPKRPAVTRPGELVQADTIVHLDPTTRKRTYYLTVIDLYSRASFAMVSRDLRPSVAARAVLAAQAKLGFRFEMIQTDNGQEFSRYFEQVLKREGIAVRHTRLGRPNDNAHIERFNRTIQEECLGGWTSGSVPLPKLQTKLANYLDYYNRERVHLGVQMKTPSEMLQRF